MTDTFVHIGARLKEERRKTGLDQEQFGRLAGASGKTQLRYETGQQLPKIEYLAALSKHDIDSGYILTGLRNDGSFLFDELEHAVVEGLRKLPEDDRKVIRDLVLRLGYARGVLEQELLTGSPPAASLDPPSTMLHSPRREFVGKGQTDG